MSFLTPSFVILFTVFALGATFLWFLLVPSLKGDVIKAIREYGRLLLMAAGGTLAVSTAIGFIDARVGVAHGVMAGISLVVALLLIAVSREGAERLTGADKRKGGKGR